MQVEFAAERLINNIPLNDEETKVKSLVKRKKYKSIRDAFGC